MSSSQHAVNWQSVESIRRVEYDGGFTYLDAMGTALAPKSAANAFQEVVESQYGNPHSTHEAGLRAANMIADMRFQVLSFFGALEQFDVVFTSGCTGGLAMVAHCFPFSERSHLLVHQFCHNSALGIRECLPRHDQYVMFTEERTPLPLDLHDDAHDASPLNLVVMPMESNFCGHRPDIAKTVQRLTDVGWQRLCIVVDGAAASGKQRIELDGSNIDVFALSFYKMFGFPTGLGALLVKKSVQPTFLSSKRYFGGGTVSSNVASKVHSHVLRDDFSAAMEDGTAHIHGIAMLAYGFAWLQRLGGAEAIGERITCLRQYCVSRMLALKHANISPVIRVHQLDESCKGSSVAFSVMEDDGAFIGYALAEKLLSGKRVLLRGGCFCNPGACEYYLDYDEGAVTRSRQLGHVCWDDMDLIDGKPTGCLRASFSGSSIPRDVDNLIDAIKSCFVRYNQQEPHRSLVVPEGQQQIMHISNIFLYPIKGIPGVAVPSWPLTSTGLFCDRQWMLVHANRSDIVSPKEFLTLSMIRLSLNFEENTLIITAPMAANVNPRSIRIQLNESINRVSSDTFVSVEPSSSDIFTIRGHKMISQYRVYSQAINDWFSGVVKTRCRLIRQVGEASLSNTAPLMIMHMSSHHAVLEAMPSKDRGSVSLLSYRPNIVLDGGVGDVLLRGRFTEFDWNQLEVTDGHQSICVLQSDGPCHRCQQVNIAHGSLSHQPLATISQLCRQSGSKSVIFGQLFQVASLTAETPSLRQDAKPRRRCRVDLCVAFVSLSLGVATRCVPLSLHGALIMARCVVAGGHRSVDLPFVDNKSAIISLNMRVVPSLL